MTDPDVAQLQTVVQAEVQRALFRVLVWVVTTGAVLLVGGVAGVTKITTNQAAMVATMAAWQKTAPAPAESTRVALRNLQNAVDELADDLRSLRRDLGRPR